MEPLKCPECGTTDISGVEIRDVYDGLLYWLCLGCGNAFHRFDKNSMYMRHLYEKAQPEIDRVNAARAEAVEHD